MLCDRMGIKHLFLVPGHGVPFHCIIYVITQLLLLPLVTKMLLSATQVFTLYVTAVTDPTVT
jgi:hypothetical protein